MISGGNADSDASVLAGAAAGPEPVSRSGAGGAAVDFGRRGPVILAAIVGAEGGPWWEEVEGSGLAAEAVREWLQAFRGSLEQGSAEASGANDTGMTPAASLLGFATVEAWSLLVGATEDARAQAQAELLAIRHRRSVGMGFCRHKFGQCAAVVGGSAPALPAHWAALTANAFFRWARDSCGGAAFRCVEVGVGGAPPKALGSVTGFAALHDMFRARLPRGQRGQCHAWRVWSPLGLCIVHGQCPVQLSAVLQRADQRAWRPPVHPPRAVRRAYLAWVKEHGLAVRPASAASAASAQGEPPIRSRHGCIVKYRPDHLVQALRCTRHLRSQGNRAFVGDVLGFVFGAGHVASALRQYLEAESVDVPPRTTLLRARPRLDVAAMGLWRQWYLDNGPVFRYVAFDASPQRSGLEVFGAAERVGCRSAVDGEAARVRGSAVVQRRLPLVSLGQGRASRADKAQAHMHQTFLDYGQSEFAFAASFRDVRQCLSDMGAEFGVGRVADIRAAYLSGDVGVSDREAEGFLFPYALEVPGSQHINDLCLRSTLLVLPFWPRWQEQAKGVCQSLASVNLREKLRDLLRSGQCGQCDVAAADASLERTCERFANWRWGTVRAACKGMLRMEAAVRAVCGPMTDYRLLGVGSGSSAELLLDVARNDAFWWETRSVLWLTKHFANFAGWVRGCQCHEEDLRSGREVTCQWKGCRAKDLSARVSAVASALDEDRRALEAGQFGPVDVSVLARSVSHGLSTFRNKFAWVNEVPYLVWQVAPAGLLFYGQCTSGVAERRKGLEVACEREWLCGRGSLCGVGGASSAR